MSQGCDWNVKIACKKNQNRKKLAVRHKNHLKHTGDPSSNYQLSRNKLVSSDQVKKTSNNFKLSKVVIALISFKFHETSQFAKS